MRAPRWWIATRHTVHHRPSCHPATASPARAAATLGRPAESAGTCQAQERSDQGQRRLHAFKGAISVPGHLGPSEARVRRLGVRALPWGTDWTRAFAVVHYEQAVEPFLKTDRLGDTERAMLMGGA